VNLDANPATAGSLVPLFISVDPARDSVGQIRSYSRDFHPKMVFLTGTQEQVARVARFFRVYFSKADEVINEDSEELEYLVDHSIVLYLMSPEGEFVDFFTQRTTVGDVVSKIEKYVKEYKPSTTTTKS